MNEPLDQKHFDEEKELRNMWQANTMGGSMDSSQLAREIAGKVNQFDRRVLWRNMREYAACVVLFIWFGFQVFDPGRRTVAIAGFAAVGFVMAYIWWQHRRTRPLDPAADARTYYSALLKRYDDQIKLLGRVKYWYVLPLYAWTMFTLLRVRPLSLSLGSIGVFAIVTAFFGFVIWLNESYGVRKLKAARKEAESLLEEQNH
jgi:uncharacterized membrane protein YbaN (DUF454 family)